jgi:pimeloyl-ACP methyl ester carboxylesterase
VSPDTPIEDLAIRATTITALASTLEAEFGLKAGFHDFFGGGTWAECLVALAASAQEIVLAAAPTTNDAPAPEPAATWDSWSTTVKRRTFAMTRWGSGTRHVAVCLHGFLDQGPIWHPVATQLVRRDWKVLAPDLPGHGLSYHLPTRKKSDFASHVADMFRVIKAQVDRPFVLVAHSMSAVLACQIASEHPDLLAGLVLVEPIPPRENQSKLIERLMKGSDSYKHPIMPDLGKASTFLRQYIPSLPKDLALLLASRITEPAKKGDGIRWTWDARLRHDAYDMVTGVSYKSYLEALERLERAPLVIRSTKSGVVTTEDVAELRARINNLSVCDLDGGHHLHIDHAVETAEQILRHMMVLG